MAISRLGAIADALIDAIRASGKEGTLSKAAVMKIPTPSSAVPLDSVRTFERRAAANPMIPEAENPLRTNVPGTPDKDTDDSQRRKDEAYLPLRFAANPNCCPHCSERDGDYVSPGSNIIDVSHPNCICQLLSEAEYQKRAKLMGSHFGTPSTAPASERDGQNANQLNTDPYNPSSPRYDPTSDAWHEAASKLSPDEKIGYSNKRSLAAMLGDQAGRVTYSPSAESRYHLTDKPSEILRRGK